MQHTPHALHAAACPLLKQNALYSLTMDSIIPASHVFWCKGRMARVGSNNAQFLYTTTSSTSKDPQILIFGCWKCLLNISTLWYTDKTMANHRFEWVYQLWIAIFKSKLSVYQRVNTTLKKKFKKTIAAALVKFASDVLPAAANTQINFNTKT